MREEGVKAPILMLSMHPEEQYAVRSLKAGASGFLNKESANEELLAAVHRVLAGRKYISASVAEKLAGSLRETGKKPEHELLSDREMQVLQHIASGKTVSEIADEISLSVNTISTYRTRILEKLSLHNNAELTRYALDNSLV
jgi:DNA-binding NarL/FixJ family response regulator